MYVIKNLENFFYFEKFPWKLGQVVEYYETSMWIHKMLANQKLELGLLNQSSESSITILVEENEIFNLWVTS